MLTEIINSILLVVLAISSISTMTIIRINQFKSFYSYYSYNLLLRKSYTPYSAICQIVPIGVLIWFPVMVFAHDAEVPQVVLAITVSWYSSYMLNFSLFKKSIRKANNNLPLINTYGHRHFIKMYFKSYVINSYMITHVVPLILILLPIGIVSY